MEKQKIGEITTEQAGKRLIIIDIALIIIFAFEVSYIRSFISGVLG